jgi:hypothetical protein
VLILPYFGKFKNYFELFLKTIGCNQNFDLLLITDSEEKIKYPDNCVVKKMWFEDFKKHIQSKFDFDISLETPYKLCDFKPAYGYICEEWITEYDYWGHCDCDLLFGDLSPVTELMEHGYDKLFVAGHLTIYKNTIENNRIFMSELPGVGCLYKQALGNSAIYAFDEVFYKVNVNNLFVNAGRKIYEKDLAYNSSTEKASFVRQTFNVATRRWNAEKTSNDQIYWDNGHIYRIGYHFFKRRVDEYIYIHLQMREMQYDKNILEADILRVEPNGFIAEKSIPNNFIDYLSNIRMYFDLKKIKMRYYRFKNKLKNELPLKWEKPWEYSPYE